MKLDKIRKSLTLLIGFLLIGGIAYGTYLFLRAATTVLISFDSDLSIAIIAAATTVLVSVLSIILSKVFEHRAQIKKEHREQRIPVYEELIQFMFNVLMATKTGEVITEKQTIEFLVKFNRSVMIWGSDEVLAAWVHWRKVTLQQYEREEESINMMFAYEKLIYAIRKDLGHHNKNLGEGDMLSLFINDIDSILARKKPTP